MPWWSVSRSVLDYVCICRLPIGAQGRRTIWYFLFLWPEPGHWPENSPIIGYLVDESTHYTAIHLATKKKLDETCWDQ